MNIALIIENSQAAKSDIVHTALTNVVEPLGHEVHHYGMYTAEDDASLTYPMNGLLTGILLNSGAADFVVTGCGTGMGSMLACNAMPGVFCGLVIDPTDAFLFGQINDGNAMSMPYAKGFGRQHMRSRMLMAERRMLHSRMFSFASLLALGVSEDSSPAGFP